MLRLIALSRLIEFESINQLKFWRFEPIQFESLGDSISKVGIDDSNQIVSSKSRIDSKKSI